MPTINRKEVRFTKKEFVIVCLILMVVFSLITPGGWLIYHDASYKGKVLDLETGQPIEGVVVAGAWDVDQYGGIGGVISTFCDGNEALTNRNGEFKVPRAFCWHWWPFSTMGSPQFIVFKHGYLGYPPLGATQEEIKSRMPDYTGAEFTKKTDILIKLGRPKTREEREFTQSHAQSLFYREAASKKLPNLIKLINEERKTLGLIGEIGGGAK